MAKVFLDIEKLGQQIKQSINVELIVEERIREEKFHVAVEFINQRFIERDAQGGILLDDGDLKNLLVDFLDYLQNRE